MLDILHNFQHFENVCTCCTTLHILHNFALPFCTILQILLMFAYFAYFCQFLQHCTFLQHCKFCTILHNLYFLHTNFALFTTLHICTILQILHQGLSLKCFKYFFVEYAKSLMNDSVSQQLLFQEPPLHSQFLPSNALHFSHDPHRPDSILISGIVSQCAH